MTTSSEVSRRVLVEEGYAVAVVGEAEAKLLLAENRFFIVALAAPPPPLRIFWLRSRLVESSSPRTA